MSPTTFPVTPLTAAPSPVLPGITAEDGPERFEPSADRIRAELDAVMAVELSPALSGWVERYATVGRRNPFLWKWCRQAVNVTTLPCVAAELREELCDTKALGVVWDVLLDDVADQGGDPGLLEALLAMCEQRDVDLRRFSPEEQRYAQFTAEVWQEIMRRARRLPRYAEFQEMLRFDYLQLGNVMRYSHLLNSQPELLNVAEHDVYTPHNMHIMICSTFDVMASPSFDRAELGRLREAIWNAQWMGRIGNLATTWQRELGEGDFTSGVYARAVAHGDLSVEQLLAGDGETIQRVITSQGHEDFYWRKWHEHRAALLSERCRLRSFDVRRVVAGLERLLCLHLGSRGRK